MGKKNDFVCLVAAMPGRYSEPLVMHSQSQEKRRAIVLVFYGFRYFKGGVVLEGNGEWSSMIKASRAPPPYAGAALQQVWVKRVGKG